MGPTSYSINLPQILLSPAASEALSYYCQSHLAPALSPLLRSLPLAGAAVLAVLPTSFGNTMLLQTLPLLLDAPFLTHGSSVLSKLYPPDPWLRQSW